MNMRLIVTLIAMSTVFLLSSIDLQAHVSPISEENFKSIGDTPNTVLIKSRLENLSGAIDVRYDREVRTRVLEYTVFGRANTEEMLGRAVKYFPLVEEKLREKNLPTELKYIAVVESMLRPTAKSHMGAFGIWQFMPSTGRMYGLEKNALVDQRADPVLATDAALNYLSDLYEQFGDWTVAMAAYNGGPGNVRKAIRRSGKTDFWGMKAYLPKETQKYVPRIIAAAYLMNYYHTHNLSPKGIDAHFQETDVVVPLETLSLVEISNNLNLDLTNLKALNPIYKTDQILANGKNPLRLPKNRLQMFYLHYNQGSIEDLMAISDGVRQFRETNSLDSLDKIHRIMQAYNDSSPISDV